MDDNRNSGKFHFIKIGSDEKITIYWELIFGNLGAKSWKASVSFTPSFGVPERALKLLFGALEDPSIQVLLELDDGKKYECVIHEILDLADCGVIDIASPNMERARITINAPKK